MSLNHDFSETVRHYVKKHCGARFENLVALFEVVCEVTGGTKRANIETHKEKLIEALKLPENADARFFFHEHVLQCEHCQKALCYMAQEHKMFKRHIENVRRAANREV